MIAKYLATKAAEGLVVFPQNWLKAVRGLHVEVDDVDDTEYPDRIVVKLPWTVDAGLHGVS